MAFEGAVRMRVDTVVEHEKSGAHIHACGLAASQARLQSEASMAGCEVSSGEGTLDAQFRAAKEGELDALVKLFRAAYWIARQELADR
jgi:hypothetical protein